MMQFIQFTHADTGKRITVNMAQVRYITSVDLSDKTGIRNNIVTCLELVEGSSVRPSQLFVTEPYTTVINAMNTVTP